MTVVSQPRQPTAADAKPPGEGSQRGRASPTDPTAPPLASSLDLARLVRDRQAEVWRYLRYLGADASEADDLTQESFLAVARSKFVEQSDPQTAGYLRTVARRQLLMLRRTQSRRITTVELDAAETVWAGAMWRDGATTDTFDDQAEAARGCVEKLEGRPRDAVRLSYEEGLGRDAIAEQLKMTADGVKTLLRRTRAKLRACIEKTLLTSQP